MPARMLARRALLPGTADSFFPALHSPPLRDRGATQRRWLSAPGGPQLTRAQVARTQLPSRWDHQRFPAAAHPASRPAAIHGDFQRGGELQSAPRRSKNVLNMHHAAICRESCATLR